MSTYFKLIFLIVVLATVTLGQNKVINIPQDYSVIQNAINASENGDTIIVSPGTYYENLNFNGKDIVLTSHFIYNKDRSLISSTILNGSQPINEDSSSVVVFVSGESRNAVLMGFTVTGGSGTKTYNTAENQYFRTGGGILIDHASPTITNNIITQNKSMNKSDVSGAGGGGMRAGQSQGIITENIFSYNKGGYAGGIMLAYCSGLIFTNNLVVNNEASSDFDGGGGIYIDWENVPIINCTIINNISGGQGGGLILTGTNKIEIMNCIIYNNITPSNSSTRQIYHRFSGTSKISHSNVEGGAEGFKNINEQPIFSDTLNYFLTDDSPGIDAGNFLPKYFDEVDSLNIETPLYPARGTLVNDQGWQGGNSNMTISANNIILNKMINKSYFRPLIDTLEISIEISAQVNQQIDAEAYILNKSGIVDVVSLENIESNGLYSGRLAISDTEDDYNILISAYLHEDSYYIADEYGLSFTTKGPIKIDSYSFETIDTIPNPGDQLKLDLNFKNLGYSETITDISVQFRKIDNNYIDVFSLPKRTKIPIDDIAAGSISSKSLYLKVDSESPTDTVQYIEAAINVNNNPIYLDTLAFEIKSETTDLSESNLSVPTDYKLNQNYPNPFNPTTKIEFSIPASVAAAANGLINVQLIVYDLLGRKVATLVNEQKAPGRYSVQFSTQNSSFSLPSGIYLYALSAGKYKETKKMLLLK